MTYNNAPLWDDTRDRWVIGECDYCSAPIFKGEEHWFPLEPGKRKVQMMCYCCRDALRKALEEEDNHEDGQWFTYLDFCTGPYNDTDREWLLEQLDDDEAITSE